MDTNHETINASIRKTLARYDAIVAEARQLMVDKTHDYGESWREMRLVSITDQILVKARRIVRLQELTAEGQSAKVSEGIESEFRDILNYAIFALIKLEEQRGGPKT